MKIKEPMSPAGMLKAARKVKDECPEVLGQHLEEPRLFEWRSGERCLYAEKSLKDLILKPSYYCPKLRTKYNGNLIFERVVEYSSRWLKQTKEGADKQAKNNDDKTPFHNACNNIKKYFLSLI